MKTDLLISPQTKANIEALIKHPSHSVIIEGYEGTGKLTLTKHIAAALLQTSTKDLTKHQVMIIQASGSSISIDEVREATKFMKLKTIGNRATRRVLIVDSAEKLTIEAQNAFLKLLEEPPSDTVIILTATSIHSLLPTIVSRAQHIKLTLPTKTATIDYFIGQGFGEAEVNKVHLLSEGRIGIMTVLLKEPEESSFVSTIEMAKQLLSKDKFNRLVEVNEIIKQKDKLAELLEALAIVCQAGLRASSANDQPGRVKRWHKSLKAIVETQDQLVHNPNPKLLMTNLMLNL